MSPTRAVVITTIQAPTSSVRAIGDLLEGWELVVVADQKTPTPWDLAGANLLSVDSQHAIGGEFSRALPFNHYSRKNLGYIFAMQQGAGCIAETDDDNYPKSTFLDDVAEVVSAEIVRSEGWVNVYRLFTDAEIWPRGFPLERVRESYLAEYELERGSVSCPIHQYLADGDPDVDAVFRLLNPEGTKFDHRTVALAPGAFCPFNSQNTVWWPDAYPLMYLPSYVSFRMTDIWRSFVAQACLHAGGSMVCFRGPTVDQIRNEHSLIADFEDELPGYLNNVRLVDVLRGLELDDSAAMGENLVRCYEALIGAGLIPADELPLVEGWLQALPDGLGSQ